MSYIRHGVGHFSKSASDVKAVSFRERVMLAAQSKVDLQEKLAMEKSDEKDTIVSSETSLANTETTNLKEVALNDTAVTNYQGVVKYLSEQQRDTILEATEKYGSGLQAEFNFSGRGLGYEGIASLILTLPFNSTNLSKLDFTDCNLDGRGMSVIYKILEANKNIRELKVSGNKVGQEFGVDWVRKMLQFCNIRVLGLARNGLGDKDMGDLMEVMSETEVLRELDLSHNLLGVLAGGVLTEYLPRNVSLRCLDLSHNELGAEGVRSMAVGLQENATLERLDISWNALMDNGMVYVAEILLKVVSLKEISLNGNFVTVIGAQHLAYSLRENCSLEVLRMGQNFLRNAGACVLVRSVRSGVSSKLRLLDLNGTLVENEFTTMYKRIQLDNSTFQITGFCVVGGVVDATFRRRTNSRYK